MVLNETEAKETETHDFINEAFYTILVEKIKTEVKNALNNKNSQPDNVLTTAQNATIQNYDNDPLIIVLKSYNTKL